MDNKYIITILKSLYYFILFLLIFCAHNKTWAEQYPTTKTVVVIHSYDYDYAWTRQEHAGILKAYYERSNVNTKYKIKTFTLDSKKQTENILKQKVQEVKEVLKDLKIEAAIITDDFAALEFMPYFKTANVPVSVAGINGDLENYGYTTDDVNVTGSLERYQLIPSIKILKKIRPSLKNIYLISDNSITGKSMLKDYVEQIEKSDLKKIGIADYKTLVTNKYEKLQFELKRLRAYSKTSV